MIKVAILCAFAAAGVTMGSASAQTASATSGSLACPDGQQVSIVSKARGHVTHSYAKGPEHLGYPVYRQNFYQALFITRYTKTGLQSAYWDVNAQDFRTTDGYFIPGAISDAFAACER